MRIINNIYINLRLFARENQSFCYKHLMLGIFSEKFDYSESWKFIYLFIIVIISLISYFLISNFLGAFKFKDIKLK